MLDHDESYEGEKELERGKKLERLMQEYPQSKSLATVIEQREFITLAIEKGAIKKNIWRFLKKEGVLNISYPYFVALLRSREYKQAVSHGLNSPLSQAQICEEQAFPRACGRVGRVSIARGGSKGATLSN